MTAKSRITGPLTAAMALTLAAFTAFAPEGTGQTTQPAVRPPTTQPDDAEPPIVMRPMVTAVRPAVEPAPVSGHELAPAPAQPATPTPSPGTQPPVPTGEDLVRDLLGGETGIRGQAGAVPPPGELARDLRIDRQRRAITGTIPTKESATVPVESLRPETRRKLLPEGYVVRNSVGYLVRDRGRWLLVFDADKSARADPPMILLPNSLLEAMQNQSSNGQEKVKFLVSGEVTQYRQTNYLLLRKVLIEHNLDRF